MRIFNDIHDLPVFVNPVITIGSFDGVHAGHHTIIQTIQDKAKSILGEAILLTFYPHPRKILFSDSNFKLINTIEEKMENLERLGLDNLVIYPFSRDFSTMSPEAYIEEVLIKKFKPKVIVIGYDHRFGAQRKGNIETFRFFQDKYQYELIEINPQSINEMIVSSSKIRTALSTGDIELANQLLGYPYTLKGRVVKGNQLGRTIGFPTANIELEDMDKMIPMNGVYGVEVVDKDLQAFKGIMNIGVKPTVDGNKQTIEVHILDFDRDIYGEKLRVNLLNFIRPEQKFASLEALKEQIHRDIASL
ncbi:MAG: bifunctional riboflavin kinase/FAD synthetase [Bacteroidetes bacterium]|nr:bifunctional riboflavin kinase/FAD synthetase [Bacteroidota bacterium]